MKICIITYYYKHKNAMASVRAIKLAKFFSKLGHEVTVLTSNQIDTWTKSYLEPVPDESIREIYAPQVKRWTLIQKYLSHRRQRGAQRMAAAKPAVQQKPVPKSKPSFKTKVLRYLSWLFYFNLAKQEDVCMFRGLQAEYRKQALPKFDAVVATYPSYGAFLMGMWLKRTNRCTKLIADFRDPLYNPGFRDRKAEAEYDLRCLKKILRAADHTVCVSQGIADGIMEACPEYSRPVAVITNGFDPEDVSGNDEQVELEKGKFHFVYTGTLYHGKRCVDMLAGVLQELVAEQKIPTDSFRFQYAGPDYGELVAQLRAYGLEHTAVDHGMVSRARSIALQKQANALLLLTWNETQYQGVVPGKLFEYIAIGNAPILALVTGDVALSEVAQIVRKSQAGCACEAAAPGDRETLKRYVQALMLGGGFTQGATEQYCYEAISKRFISLIEGEKES